MARILTIFGSFLLCSALLTWGAAARLGSEALQRGAGLYGYRMYFDRILRTPSDRKRPLVVWLGDSTIMGLKRRSYPQLLRPWLHRKGIDTEILAGPAWDPYVFYFLSSRVVEHLDPTVVVIVARIAAFHPKGSLREFRYNDVSSYLRPALLPRTFLLPLAPRQLSPARLLLAQTLNDPTAQQIFYAAEGMRLLYTEAPFWKPLGPVKPPRIFNPLVRNMLEDHDAAITRRQPGVAMLEATVRVLTEAGIAALVVASPIPYEAMRSRPRGYDPTTAQRHFDLLRAVVEDAGGMFVDVHQLLPADEFVDYAGHFSLAGAQRVSRGVWVHVREALRRANSWPSSWTPRRPER